MASKGGKVFATPRSINVQKFAESRGPELESLQTIVANRLNDDFRSRRNSRRRTTGHDDRVGGKKGRKRRRGGDGSSGLLGEVEGVKKLSRRVRRRVEFKDNQVDGFSTSGDGTKRLRTHVWHAKRFTMTKLWGFHLPLGLQGRGKGSRALLKWYRHGALVHDASYFTCVELEGLEVSIESVLKTVLSSSETEPEDVRHVLSGTICGSGMLHHFGSSSQAIAPVTYMWRPNQSQKIISDKQCGHEEFDGSNCLKNYSSYRQLWVWLHASAFDEGFEALKAACSKLMNESGHGIALSSLAGKVTKFHVIGSKAWQLLQKVLQVIRSDNRRQLNAGSFLNSHSDFHRLRYYKLESDDKSASHSICSLTVKDPRDLSVGTSMLASGGELPVPTLSKTLNIEDEGDAANIEILDSNDHTKVSSSSLEFASDNFTDETLWNAKSGVGPPVDEQSLSVEKHNLRLKSYSIPDLNSKESADLAKSKLSRSCPIILIKDANFKDSHTGWTIILPVSWAKTFWMPLVLNGAHAIGLREKHWIASEMGLPYFPLDFPDCKAYASYQASEAVKYDQEADRRPPAARHIRVPISAPWNCVKLALDAYFSKPAASNADKNLHEAVTIQNSLSGKPDSVASDSIQQNHNTTQFAGPMARTSSELSCFVDQNIGQKFPIFPFSANKKRLSEWVQSENINQTETGSAKLKKYGTLNFVRVILRAYREGVFEDGAVVCAPLPADIQSCKSSLISDGERLRIPQSSVSTYFIEQTPGEWTLQMPKDSTLLQTHRWPIGFVTSGFVRGSKKPAACAFCDASMLGCVRQEQWKNLPAKKRTKDIYVIIRNLRSNTYRLATANIVLEHQATDMAFM